MQLANATDSGQTIRQSIYSEFQHVLDLEVSNVTKARSVPNTSQVLSDVRRPFATRIHKCALWKLRHIEHSVPPSPSFLRLAHELRHTDGHPDTRRRVSTYKCLENNSFPHFACFLGSDASSLYLLYALQIPNAFYPVLSGLHQTSVHLRSPSGWGGKITKHLIRVSSTFRKSNIALSESNL